MIHSEQSINKIEEIITERLNQLREHAIDVMEIELKKVSELHKEQLSECKDRITKLEKILDDHGIYED